MDIKLCVLYPALMSISSQVQSEPVLAVKALNAPFEIVKAY